MRRWRRVLALADRPLVKGVGEVARGSHEGGHGQGKLRHAHAPLDRSVDASGGVLGPDENGMRFIPCTRSVSTKPGRMSVTAICVR